jgi:hypothetical protein
MEKLSNQILRNGQRLKPNPTKLARFSSYAVSTLWDKIGSSLIKRNYSHFKLSRDSETDGSNQREKT